MDIERPSTPSNKFVLKDFLANELKEYTEALAAGQWHKKTIRHVANSRILTEEFGREEIGDAGDDELAPITNTIELTFEAHKTPFQTDDGEDTEVANYTLESRVSQYIVASEMPEEILSVVIEEARYDDAHPLWNLVFSEEDEGDAIDDQTIKDALYTVDITRAQVLEYTFDHRGRMCDYKLSYEYLFDDETVHEVSHELASAVTTWEPVHRNDPSMTELRPIGLPELTEDGIAQAFRDIEKKIDTFFTDEEAEDIAADAELPHKEHVRRALGMLGLISGKSYRNKR